MRRGCHLFVAAPLSAAKRASLEHLLKSMNDWPGRARPNNPVIPFAAIDTLHFARLVILDDPSLPDRVIAPSLPAEEPVRLALIADGDGTADELLDTFVAVAASGLERVFSHCEDFIPGNLREWLARHRIEPAARYVNAPRRSARQLREEAALHAALYQCRAAHPDLSTSDLLPFLKAAGNGVTLTPLVAPGPSERLGEAAHFMLLPALGLLLSPILLVALPFLALVLRRKEVTDPVIAPRPSRARNRLLSNIEDRDLSNQYGAIGALKPGLFRRWLAIVILWIIDWGSRHLYTRDRLARVNTIHAASWTFLDDRRRVYFASNYDGSREAYNDDFINKVAFGLNLSFSSALGYPRTSWLILGGAWHEQDFKRYLFHHQIPTQVWYKPDCALTNYDMERNSRIRKGFEQALKGGALRRWVAEI
jgi:hypothetical protein